MDDTTIALVLSHTMTNFCPLPGLINLGSDALRLQMLASSSIIREEDIFFMLKLQIGPFHHPSEQMIPHLDIMLHSRWFSAHAVLAVSSLILGDICSSFKPPWFHFSGLVKCLPLSLPQPHAIAAIILNSS